MIRKQKVPSRALFMSLLYTYHVFWTLNRETNDMQLELIWRFMNTTNGELATIIKLWIDEEASMQHALIQK